MYEHIMVIGNVGNVKEGTGAKPYLRMSIATNSSYKDKSGKEHEQTNWYSVTLWDDKRIEYYKGKIGKGDLVLVTGTPSLRTYENDDKKGVELAILTEFDGKFKILKHASNVKDA